MQQPNVRLFGSTPAWMRACHPDSYSPRFNLAVADSQPGRQDLDRQDLDRQDLDRQDFTRSVKLYYKRKLKKRNEK
jgi:hypothetical protein